MSASHRQIVNEGLWVGMARDEAREWFREHPGAPLEDFGEWVCREYEPWFLRSCGYRGGPLSGKLRGILDDIHLGLTEAAEAELRQRAYRAA